MDQSQRIDVNQLAPVNTPPVLVRVSLTGFTLMGVMRESYLNPRCFMMYWFTVLGIPLIPICVYLVQPVGRRSYTFYRKLSLSQFHSLFQGRMAGFYLGIVKETVLFLAIAAVAIFCLFYYL